MFLKPLKQSSIVKPETIAKIFSNLEEICEQHEMFSKELENEFNKGDEEGSFGGCFLHKDGFFEKYSIYINNFDIALETIHEEMQYNLEFRDFIEICETNPQCKANPLPSFLILPIQRIPRYLL